MRAANHQLMLLNMLSIGALSHSQALSRSRLAFAPNTKRLATLRVQLSDKSRAYLNKNYCSRRCMLTSLAHVRTPNEIEMREDAIRIIKSAIRAVDPYVAVRDRVRVDQKEGSSTFVVQRDGTELTYDLSKYDRIKLFAFGKASATMALAAAEILITTQLKLDGIVIIKDDHATPKEIETLQKYDIAVRAASHPVPDSRSVESANEILASALKSDSRTLIVVCISGGGSALFCSPREPLSLNDLMDTNSALLKSGMPIDKMNIIRKRLENGKGGKLAAASYPATVLTLILSDIIGDPLDLIASGPTVADDSDWEHAIAIVEEYGLDEGGEHELPMAVLRLLKMGHDGLIDDTPKKDNPAFSFNSSMSTSFSENVLVGNNRAAVMAAADEANRLGYNPVVLGTRVEGEASCVAGIYVNMADTLSLQRDPEINAKYQIGQLPVALIAGGETTVTLPPDCKGKGGRNQELALAAAIRMQEIGLQDVLLASVGSDGTDGPTDAAGAMVDGSTVKRIEDASSSSAKDALRNHDAYNFFSSGNDGSLIMTGPTQTNVADICITLVR